MLLDSNAFCCRSGVIALSTPVPVDLSDKRRFAHRDTEELKDSLVNDVRSGSPSPVVPA